MLLIAENVLFFKVFNGLAIDNVLPCHAVYKNKGDWPLVGGIDLSVFLYIGITRGCFQAFGTVPWESNAWYDDFNAGYIFMAIYLCNLTGILVAHCALRGSMI